MKRVSVVRFVCSFLLSSFMCNHILSTSVSTWRRIKMQIRHNVIMNLSQCYKVMCVRARDGRRRPSLIMDLFLSRNFLEYFSFFCYSLDMFCEISDSDSKDHHSVGNTNAHTQKIFILMRMSLLSSSSNNSMNFSQNTRKQWHFLVSRETYSRRADTRYEANIFFFVRFPCQVVVCGCTQVNSLTITASDKWMRVESKREREREMVAFRKWVYSFVDGFWLLHKSRKLFLFIPNGIFKCCRTDGRPSLLLLVRHIEEG